MSRHKLVKTLDFDDELEDYSGGATYDQGESVGEEATEEEKERLRDYTVLVRQTLDPNMLHIPDKEIEDSLWYYYYDLDKTVNWLRGRYTQGAKEKKAKHQTLKGSVLPMDANSLSSSNAHLVLACYHLHQQQSYLTSTREFFKDSPWSKIPTDRRGEIIIEPRYPRGGLLGGSAPKDGKGKVSKLAALAAARKRKEDEKNGDPKAECEPGNKTVYGALELLDERKEYTTAHRLECITSLGRLSKPYHLAPGNGRNTSQSSLEEVKSSKASISEENPPDWARLRADPSAFAIVILKRSLENHLLPPERRPREIPIAQSFAKLNITKQSAFVGPSPDDIITTAQRAKGIPTYSKVQGEEQATKQMINGVKTISVGDLPKAKSKNLDVLAEYGKGNRKQAVSFVVIGHVDHGKSTLLGRLLLDLRVVDSRTVEKYRKEAATIGKSSFALAWVLDQTSEERNRGVTMDIAMSKFETEKTKFTVFDAPGHRDFIPNMIAGASQADFAVLVIDASSNAFESGLKGQTREHALLIRSMGVQRIIVAVNKMDAVNWAEERFQEIEQQTLAFLTTSGFQHRNISFLPCSGLNGDNIARVTADSRVSWYTGLPLVGLLEEFSPAVSALSKPLRLTIIDVFRGGVVYPISISGRIEAGSLQIGDSVLAMPSGEKASVKGIELDDKPHDWAVAGQNIVLHLSDIQSTHLKSGDVLCLPESPISNVSSLTMKVLVFDHVTPMSVDVHRGRLHVPGRISQLIATLDKATGEVTKKKPKILKPGSVARIKVELEQLVPLEAPTRIILRANGETVAAGLLE